MGKRKRVRFDVGLVRRGDRETLYRDPNAPVQPQQQRWEFRRLLKFYERLNPKTVLEIGSADGGSLYQFMKHTLPGGLFITVDSSGYTEQWQEWAGRFHHALRAVVGDSIVPSTILKVKSMVSSVDFLMIDAGHNYKHVRRDFLNYGPLVKPGGAIALHDIATISPDYGVRKFWLELCRHGYVVQALIAEQGEYGTGIVYVGEYIAGLQ